MEILPLCTFILAAITCLGTSLFVIHTVSALREVKEDQKFLMQITSKTFAITSALRLQQNFDQINDMKKALNRLIKEENYEDANKLKAVIDENMECALNALEAFRKTFGEDIAASIVALSTMS